MIVVPWGHKSCTGRPTVRSEKPSSLKLTCAQVVALHSSLNLLFNHSHIFFAVCIYKCLVPLRGHVRHDMIINTKCGNYKCLLIYTNVYYMRTYGEGHRVAHVGHSNQQVYSLCILIKKMKVLAVITIIYSICLEIQPQLIFPDSVSHPGKKTSSEILNVLQNVQRGTPEYEKRVEEIVTGGISKLAITINNFYLTQKNLNNIVFSPVSIAGALALILLGSNGKTFDELAQVMGFASGVNISSNSRIVHENLGKLFFKLHESSGLDEQIDVAAAIFVQQGYPIRDLYKEMSRRIYNNEVLNVDFHGNGEHAQQVINTWVASKTNGKIRSVLAEPPPDETKVIIASALYFNGAWEKQFWEGFTRRRPFYPNGRRTHTNIEVEMMSNGGLFAHYRDITLDCDIMGFPYKGNKTTMYVIIPQDSNIDRLKSFEAALTSEDILRLVKSTTYTQSVVLFPKMKVEATSDLQKPLQSLGVKSLFNPHEANLALLSPGKEHKDSDARNQVYNSVPNSVPHAAREPVGRERSDILIFSRVGSPVNCTQIFNPNSNISECEEIDSNTQKQVTYKKFGDKLGRRVTRETPDTLDKLRAFLNRDPHNLENPGIYADQVIHKVYIDITERGTEAAASTSVSLTRGGDITIFRADIPFLFFIWHEETKLILFWGTVYEPTPRFS
ncbi:SRPN6 [Trypoxylus dichotomus]